MIGAVFGVALAAMFWPDAAPLQNFASPRAQVWIDTDAACGAGPLKDVDDCFAILALAEAHGLKIAGVSTTYGNAARTTVDRTVTELFALWPKPETAPRIRIGARKPADCRSNAAAAAIIAAAHEAPTIVLALGPLTNVACAMKADPGLAKRLTSIIFVGGARSGHVFHPAEGARGAILFGHGPIISDMNVEKDPGAVAQVFQSGVALSLVPYELARQIEIDAAALGRLSTASVMAQEVARRARPWLSTWRKYLGRDGFYPFDLMAVVALVEPQTLACSRQTAIVVPDERISGNRFGPMRLLVGAKFQGEGAEVLWCDRLANPAQGARAVLHLVGA